MRGKTIEGKDGRKSKRHFLFKQSQFYKFTQSELKMNKF